VSDEPQLSLWRGDRLVGRIHLRFALTDEELHGVVIPMSDTSLLESMWQHVVGIFPGKPVYQQPLPRDVVAERHREPDTGPSQSITLIEEGSRPKPGVPRDEQFLIYEEWRGFLPTKSLSITEHVPIPGAPDPELATFPPGAVVRGSVWSIFAVFADEVGAA
jgi:hypothetical protein